MVKSTIRAKRRAALQNKKRRARKLLTWCDNPEKNANHIAACSCWMCGNPRKYFGEKTIQEIKAEWSARVE